MISSRSITPSPAVLWVVHFAFITAIPVYAAMHHFVLAPQAGAQANAQLRGLMLAIFAGISFIEILLAMTVDHWLKLEGRAGMPPAGTADGYLARSITRMIVVNALLEAIAIYGLVGVFFAFKPWESYLFMGVALLALIIRIAAVRDITDTYEQMKRNE